MVFKRQQQFEINWLWWEKGINPFYAVCIFSPSIPSRYRFHFNPPVQCVLYCNRAEAQRQSFYWFFFDKDFMFYFFLWTLKRLCHAVSGFIVKNLSIFLQNFPTTIFMIKFEVFFYWWSFHSVLSHGLLREKFSVAVYSYLSSVMTQFGEWVWTLFSQICDGLNWKQLGIFDRI